MLRSWQGCFLLTGIVFLLQLFPYTGIFLMMLAAPYWSVLLINLGFILMVHQGVTQAQSRWLRVFPTLWFGGYLGFSAASHWQVHRFNAAIVAANAGKRVPFDQAKWDVLITPDRSDSNHGSSLTATNLVQSFGLTRAYEAYGIAGWGSEGVQEYVLSGASCPDSTGFGQRNGNNWQRVTTGGYGTGERMRSAKNLCFRSGPGFPERLVIDVRPQPQITMNGLANFTTQNVVIAPVGGKAVSLQSGWGSALSWLPQPVVGCVLNSGAPAWECDAGFIRESRFDRKNDRTPNGADDVAARALGLVKGSIADRYPGAIWQ
ncbi:MAG: hypothetical protein PSY12_10995 [bacterium]|nr:hypothetical protein [bacterium]